MNNFDEFWKLYPRKIGKGAARKSYLRAIKICKHEDIIAGVQRFVDADPQRGDMQFCPHPTTWLNQERWDDEYEQSGIMIDNAIMAAARLADEEEENGVQNGSAHLRLI